MSQWKESSLFILDSPAEFGLPPTTALATPDSYSCSSSGRCTRENCKYLHPPPHLKTQLEINGRNTLATQKMLQNLQNQQLQQVVGMTNMNLQLQPSQSALLQGGQGMPTGPGSNSIVIPTSQYTKDSASASAAAAAAAAASLYQHAPSQMYNGLQIMTQSPYALPPAGGQGQPQVHASHVTSGTSAMYSPNFLPVGVSMGQPQVHASQATSDMSAMYSPYFLPVAVSMAQTMPSSTHSTPGSYGPYFMPFPNPASTCIGGLGNPASMGLMPADFQGLQTQMIPGPAGQGYPTIPSMKPKNDKLELPTTPESVSLKRPRDASDDAILNLAGLAPPPMKKITAGTLSAHQGTAPMMNFLPHAQFPYHPQLSQAMLHQAHQQTPVVPTPFPIMPSMGPGGPGQSIPLFAPHMMPTQVHTPRHPQTNETIPVCRDFKSGSCKRPSCKYAHVTEDYVEIIDGKVTLCRYAVQNRCTRQRCKFYHPPPATSALAAMMAPNVPLSALPPTGISSI